MAKYLLFWMLLCCAFAASAQSPENIYSTRKKRNHIRILDDAYFSIGMRALPVFALDDRAPLSANPHFKAMMNLVRLGATLEAMLQGAEQPLNDIDFGKQFGMNGYNKTAIQFFFRYGFGESSDLKLQTHFFELALSSGYFRQASGGMHVHLEYQMNLAKTRYGAGARSISKAFEYEVYVGGRIGMDWSSGRSESEAGFFTHLSEELRRISNRRDFSAAQLIMLEELAQSSRILLPKDVGGRAFHIGPVAGARLSKNIMKNGRVFAGAMGFYDLMDLTSGNNGKENRRSQHHLALELGFSLTLGAEGEMINFF